MAQETLQPELTAAGGDRRRVPRYSCSGQVQIRCLPLSGALLRGRVRDLGLGGCCIDCLETAFPLDLGAQTDILVEVNSWFFRAMGHVRALRGRSGISVQFLRMSAGGFSTLAELIADLERPQTGATRQENFREHARRVLSHKFGAGLVLKNSVAVVGTIVPAESAEGISPDASHRAWAQDSYPGATSVDIFI